MIETDRTKACSGSGRAVAPRCDAWCIAALCSLVLMAGAGAATAASEHEQAETCREAEQRYQELYGKLPSAEAEPVVTMYKHTFCPPRLTVRQGTVVRFINVDRRTSHSFWFKDAGQAESERFFPGEGASITIDLAPGEHIYLCGPHWEQEKMVGRITVTPR